MPENQKQPGRNDPPLVSVIMPAYNHEKYVESAVRSVWALDYRPVELIVLDDGSSDKTLSVLQDLQTKSPVSMTVIHKQNEGICKTLNHGIALAEGKYVTFLASDDEFVPERQSLHVAALESNKDAMVAGCYGQRCIMYDHGRTVLEVVKKHTRYDDQFRVVLEGKTPYHLQGSTFKLDVVKELRFDPELFFEDWDFFLRLTLKYKMLYVPGVAFRYRRVETGMNHNVQRMAAARLDFFNKHRNHPRVHAYGVKKAKSRVDALNAQGFFLMGQYAESRHCLLSSWRNYPFSLCENLPLMLKLIMGPSIVGKLRRSKRLLIGDAS